MVVVGSIYDWISRVVNCRWVIELERDVWHGFRQIVVMAEAIEQQTDVDVGVITVIWSTTQ